MPSRNKKSNDYINVYTSGIPLIHMYGQTSRLNFKSDHSSSKKLIQRNTDSKNKSINDALNNFQLEQASGLMSKDYAGVSQSPEEGVPVLKIDLNDPNRKSIVISQSDFCKSQ